MTAPFEPESSRPSITLELEVAPADAKLLLRQPELKGPGRGPRAVRRSIVWHESPDGQLAADGLALARWQDGSGSGASAPVWRLERLVPDDATTWPPCGAAPLIEDAAAIEDLKQKLPPLLLPTAAFEGQVRALPSAEPALQAWLLEGTLRAVTATLPVCRLLLSGPAAAVAALALSQRVTLSAPRGSLAEAALVLAGRSAPVRPLGAPSLPAMLDVDGAFALIVAHLAGVMRHHAPAAARAEGMEPVHQMRVALRRLRSAIQLFRRAVACPELDDATVRLRELGHLLGPPRDWDVFTSGVGREIERAFAADEAVAHLLEAAERRRLACYRALAAYLDGPAFPALMIALAGLALARPWHFHTPDDPEEAEKRLALQHDSLKDFADKALGRRLAKVIAPGRDLSHLTDEALHEIRLHTKRLRYATEFFAPLFPGRETRRFLRRMSALQERLGLLNDGAVAAALMAKLPRSGADRRTAIGLVRGFVAARATGGRRKIDETWQRFLKLEPFWH